MHRSWPIHSGLRSLLGIVIATFLAPATVTAEELPTLFRDYVAQPDPEFNWKVVSTVDEQGLATSIIDLKSQKWRTAEEVDRPIWQHWLTISRPERVTQSTALLIISGGSNGSHPPEHASQRALDLARRSHSVVAELKCVPNEPLLVKDAKQPLEEDALLAFCMERAVQTGDYTWLPRLPMVKSAVKAMDAVQQALADKSLPESKRANIQSFVVTGASKRGWTTWLVPTVDKRVKAIMPMVIDVLNVRPSMAHHLAAYGKWSPALGDYERQRLLNKQAMDRSHALMALDDPYTYRSQLGLPKYIVNAAGDEYFLPDSSQFYFAELPDEKHLRYVPNADHSLKGSDVLDSSLAFYEMILNDEQRPSYQWKLEADGAILFATDAKPSAVRHWQANNPDARDFRLEVLGPEYKAETLTSNAAGEYCATISKPKKGWTAHFIEAEFPTKGGPWKVTSAVLVVPNTLPCAELAKPLLGGQKASP
jgi:PhoPQ-activated pathogenicity-related protein